MISFISTFIFISCNKETIKEGIGKVIFSLNITKFNNLKSSDTIALKPTKVIVSIEDMSGKNVIDSKEIIIYQFGESYISEPVALAPGNYKLIKFIILNSENNAIYATPIEGSEKAYLVNDPLPINFAVIKDEVTKLTPEVITIATSTPADFGYETFSFNLVKIFDFQLAIFIYDDSIKNFKLTDAKISIKNGDKTVYENSLTAITNTITIREDISEYKIIITKSGYKTFDKTYKIDTLKSLSEPLMIILEKINVLVLQPGPEEGKDAVVASIIPDQNRGLSSTSSPYAWTQDGKVNIVRPLIDFNIKNFIQKGTIIKKATLYLFYAPYGISDKHEGSNEFYIKRIIAPWDELTVTWDNQPATTNEGAIFVPKSISQYQDYEIDITSLIQEIINKPESSYGIMMQLLYENPYNRAMFASSDYPDSTKHPKLVINF